MYTVCLCIILFPPGLHFSALLYITIYAHLTLLLAVDGYSASHVGTIAATIDENEPTMWLDLAPTHYEAREKSAVRYKATILHEFGHALGLQHEHQHPDAPSQYTSEKLLDHLKNHPPKLGNNETLEGYITTNWSPAFSASTKCEYDRDSIMHYL